MQNKVSVNTNIGMLRDRSISKVDNQFAFENHNIRITARDKDTLLSVTNERGNVPITFSSSEEAKSYGFNGIFKTEILGTLLGYAVLNDYLVLFTKGGNTDRIYRVEYRTKIKEWYLRLLYEGSLGFSTKYPIETIPLFETEDVQKVYWVDGINQPRVINIMKNYFTVSGSTVRFSKNTIFDFVTDYNHSGNAELSVSIEKQQLGMGAFPAGTIQYLCTYYNKYGQETNPVYISPLYYVSPEDRGGDAETTYTCSFKISLENVDTEFDSIRIYAILRTSESGTPIAYIAGTINIQNDTLTLVDTGQGDNIIIDPTILLYVGGREIVAGTFSHKDNTLFLGDIQFSGSRNDDTIASAINNSNIYNKGTGTNRYESNIIQFSTNTGLTTPYYENDGLYPYKSQLNESSDEITGFKGGEKYRFALQFITATGQRSRAFFIGDKVNPYYPSIDTATNTIKRSLPVVTIPQYIVTTAKEAGYVQAVLLMAEASDGDRAVVAQGIISPTVFNLGQRSNNAPYAISSWYMRPRNSQINSRHFESVNNVSSVEYDEDGETVKSANVTFCEIQNIRPGKAPYYNEDSFDNALLKVAYAVKVNSQKSAGAHNQGYVNIALYSMYLFQIGQNMVWKKENDDSSDTAGNFPSTLTDSDYTNMTTSLSPKYTSTTVVATFINNDKPYNRFVDAFVANVINNRALAPEHQELNDLVEIRMDGGSYNFTHILGRTEVQDIQGGGEKDRYSNENSEQFFVDENIITFNTPDIEKLQSSDINNLSFRIIGISEATSNISDYTLQTTTGRSISASVYRTELNHSNSTQIEGLITYPLLYDVAPVDSSGEFIPEDQDSGDSSQNGLPLYFDIYPFHKEGSIIYNEKLKQGYSKIEKKIFANLRYCYNTKFLWTDGNEWMPEGGSVKTVTSSEQSSQFRQLKDGASAYIYQGTYDYMSATGTKKYSIFGIPNDVKLSEQTVRGTASKSIGTTSEPVRIQYQSLPHVVIKLGKTQGKNELLPLLTGEATSEIPDNNYFPWEDTTQTYQQRLSYSTSIPYYFIGELYKDISQGDDRYGDDRYGGTTQAAVENNRFIPISKRYNLGDDALALTGTQGDTFFQRWDCLKTEPYSNESKNGIVDITSFMVETHTNIEGRYDTRRGLLKNVTTSRENSNLINRVYSNLNNFFSSNVLNDKYYLSDFHNQITWTKTKTLAEDIDTWTNITVANTLDLDGDKGPVRAIRRFNNSLIAFQDKGIAEILFNSRTQLSTTSGVPIEIGNSGKVEGKRYVSEKSGCINKWSIVEAKTGIYFIDNINKNISVIGQGLQDISGSKGFSSWIRSYNSLDVWNPDERNNFTAFYDSVHNDIYFVTKHEDMYNDDSCLVYNETLGQFTSFFDYEDLPMMVNVKDRFLSFKNQKLWLQNEGEYNKLFRTKYPYWVKYRICPDPYGDKTFNNIEYRADIITPNDESDVVEQSNYLTNKTFDSLKIWNEYQEGSLDLTYDSVKVSDLKRKFRIWRANIPRDSKDPRKLNRIRNPWVYLQLSKYKELDNERMEFHDLLVKYYE